MSARPPWFDLIVDVPDFPKPGIVFKDITPLLADPGGFRQVIDAFAERAAPHAPSQIIGVESRGFIFGAALARALDVGLTLVRKPGKLPRQKASASYALEYGTDTLEMHADALRPGDRALIIDDVLATGGTAAAVAELVGRTGAELVGYGFLMELSFLNGRERLPTGSAVESLIIL